ncbi:MAG: hypothetical protein V9G19_16975 [Tetrasphaera sp.]
MTDDLLTQLTAADPATRVDLSRIDETAFAPLREGIPMTPRPTTTPRKRLRRRTIALVAGAALLLGGTATAAYDKWYAGGAADGLTCMTTWVDPLTTENAPSTGGPALTTDPVADCQRYQRESGESEIANPVAFSRNGQVFVVPRDQVPADGNPLGEAPADTAAAMELRSSLGDWVDGGESGCYDRTTGPAFIRKELARLGLTGWEVTIMPDNRPYEEGPCGFFDVDMANSEARFFPDRQEERSADEPQGALPFVYEVREALRSSITDTCLSVSEAGAAAKRAVGAEHHWPTTAVVDNSADCARVDMQVGGSIQITVYGPTTATG